MALAFLPSTRISRESPASPAWYSTVSDVDSAEMEGVTTPPPNIGQCLAVYTGSSANKPLVKGESHWPVTASESRLGFHWSSRSPPRLNPRPWSRSNRYFRIAHLSLCTTWNSRHL